MNVNATIIGQMITFFILIWFVMKYVWKPISAMMAERSKRIADGLAASERGLNQQKLAEKEAEKILHEAKIKAAEVVAQAEKRASEIVEESKGHAREEGERLVSGAKAEIEQEIFRAREALRQQISDLAVAGAEKILRKEIDAKAHAELLNALKQEL